MENRIAITTPEYVKLEFETAGLGSRTLSLLIDWMILGVVQFILIFFGILFFAASATLGNPFWTSVTIGVFLVLLFFIPLCYYVLTEYFMNGQTIGKRAVGLRVVTDRGTAPGFLAIFLRNLLRVVDGLPFFYLAGGISVFFNRREKRLGDLAAGTMVVQKEKREVPHVHPLFSHREPILTSSELSGISERKWELLGRFLTRREEMFPAARQELAQRLARSLLPLEKVGGGQEEFYLEAAYFQLRNRQRVGESGFLER
ncbi:membrane protein [Kroppenstedtia guangzhouensis]|uniref:Membrane protein n=1 Tax=Kroppenstedtia guangzhouensis TaxID=1274356 RepID=A0ABQ1H4C9_9BACL|nr:RDD family protein [Kroppenstedtia guangzhouensis]GGA57757.1 membrane protein [Kroppenstedtia guangzhouensis]